MKMFNNSNKTVKNTELYPKFVHFYDYVTDDNTDNAI
jgi:hypothetical protein